MTKSDQLNELAAALVLAQGEIKNAVKDAANPFFKSHYADLASVREAIQMPFRNNGLSVTQLLGNNENGVTVETVLLHKSGQWLAGTVAVKPVKDDPQALGSAVTYARRYSLSAIAGIAGEEDDDGEAAMGRGGKDNKTPATKAAASTPTAAVPHPAVVALKPGEVCTVQRTLSAWHQPAKGKTLGRAVFANDPTSYGCDPAKFCGKAGDTLTVEVKCHESDAGAIWYELTNVAPF